MVDANITEIDGSLLEGGGQILRNAIAYSCLLKKAIQVIRIRAGRSTPGLRPQHLCGAQLIRDLSHGTLRGDAIGSSEITFIPGKAQSGSHQYVGDTKTAGSICLLLQTALPCLMFSDSASELILLGGTNAEMAPQFDYMTMVTMPLLAKFGLKVVHNLICRGFYPKGGGKVTLTVKPVKTVSAIEMVDRGDIVKISGLSFVAGTLPIKVAHIMASAARDKISTYCQVPVEIERQKIDQRHAFGNGSGIIIVAKTSTGCLLGGSALGKRDKPAEVVGAEAADQLMRNLKHGGCVDDYMQDQMIMFMALAKGMSKIKCGPVTLHTETAIHIASLLTEARFTVEKLDENTNLILCEGIGLENKLL